MAAYCAASDLYDHGLPRGAVPNPGRICGAVNASANTIALDVHGFATDDPIVFRAEAGGTLPAPLVEGTTYYAIAVGDSDFSVAAAPGGSAIDLTSAGTTGRVLVITPLPIAAACEWASRLIDSMLPSAIVPLTAPYPAIVRFTAAELAAGKLLQLSGGASKSLSEIATAAQKRLEKWLATGMPIRGENAPTPANVAASASVPYDDPRGWNRWGGL